MSNTVWTCMGVIDEAHPLCHFATRHQDKAEAHAGIPGHVCVSEEVPGEWPLSELQLEVLKQEDEEMRVKQEIFIAANIILGYN